MKVHKVFQDIRQFRELLKQGMDPNELDVSGNTHLHNAPTVEMVKLLISYGADPTIKNLAGNTPIDNNRDKLPFGSDEFKEKTRAIITLLSNPHVGVVELIEDAHDEIENLKNIIEEQRNEIENLKNIIEEQRKQIELLNSQKPKTKKADDRVWVCKNPISKLSTSVEDRLQSCQPQLDTKNVKATNLFRKRTECMKSCVK